MNISRVLNSNTADSNLKGKVVTTAAVDTQSPAHISLPRASVIVETPDKLAPMSKASVPDVTVTTATATNPTTFETTTFTVGEKEIIPVLLSVSGSTTNPDMGHNLSIDHLIGSAKNTLADSAQQTWFGLLLDEIYGTVKTVSAAAFAEGDFTDTMGGVSNRTIVALQTAHAVKVKPTWLMAGQPNVVQEGSSFTGAADNVCGFVARPECSVTVVGWPTPPPVAEAEVSLIDLPCGIRAQLCKWWSRSSRAQWFSLDVVLGVIAAKTDALKLVKSA